MIAFIVIAAITLLGWIVTIVGFIFEPHLSFASYLAAYTYWFTLGLGMLYILMIGVAIRARWFVVLRRLAELTVAAFPALALLFVPILFGMGQLYPWSHPPAEGEAHRLQAYLNVPGFVVRAASYFAVFIFVSEMLLRWSLASDAGPSVERYRKQQRLAAVGLVAVSFATTFASFDWLMSLPEHWYTTMFGVYLFAGSFLGGLALLTLLAYFAQRGGPLERLSTSHFYALGRLLFAFVVFWAYIAFSQFFLVWMSDLPEKITWYLERLGPSWIWTSRFLIVGHFAIPFLLLLSRDIKQRPAALAVMSAWILGVHFVDVWWVVIPSVAPEAQIVHWSAVSAFVAVGGTAALVASWRARRRPLLVVNDPLLDASLRYSSP